MESPRPPSNSAREQRRSVPSQGGVTRGCSYAAPHRDKEQRDKRNRPGNPSSGYAFEAVCSQKRFHAERALIMVPRLLDSENLAQPAIKPVLRRQGRDEQTTRFEPSMQGRDRDVEVPKMFEHIRRDRDIESFRELNLGDV